MSCWKRVLAWVVTDALWLTSLAFLAAPMVLPWRAWLAPVLAWLATVLVGWRVVRWLRRDASE